MLEKRPIHCQLPAVAVPFMTSACKRERPAEKRASWMKRRRLSGDDTVQRELACALNEDRQGTAE